MWRPWFPDCLHQCTSEWRQLCRYLFTKGIFARSIEFLRIPKMILSLVLAMVSTSERAKKRTWSRQCAPPSTPHTLLCAQNCSIHSSRCLPQQFGMVAHPCSVVLHCTAQLDVRNPFTRACSATVVAFRGCPVHVSGWIVRVRRCMCEAVPPILCCYKETQ